LQLKLELVFRLLTLRFTPLLSYIDFLKLIPGVIKSRRELRKLAGNKRLQGVSTLFAKLQQQINQHPVQLQQR
jgi:hypothetical protein